MFILSFNVWGNVFADYITVSHLTTSGSTQAQVMACCQTAQRHYLNQYYLSLVRFIRIHSRTISPQMPRLLLCIMSLKITLFKLIEKFFTKSRASLTKFHRNKESNCGDKRTYYRFILATGCSRQTHLAVFEWIYVTKHMCVAKNRVDSKLGLEKVQKLPFGEFNALSTCTGMHPVWCIYFSQLCVFWIGITYSNIYW